MKPKEKMLQGYQFATRRENADEVIERERERGKKKKSSSFRLFLFFLPLLLSSASASTCSSLGEGRQDVKEHHDIDRDHRDASGEHEAPGVVQRGARTEERGGESCG